MLRNADGRDVSAEVTLDLDDVAVGVTVTVRMTSQLGCSACEGSGKLQSGMDASACQNCSGQGYVPTPHQVKVRVPLGVRNGALLKAPGRGEPACGQGLPGDLYLKIAVAPGSLSRASYVRRCPLNDRVRSSPRRVRSRLGPWRRAPDGRGTSAA